MLDEFSFIKAKLDYGTHYSFLPLNVIDSFN